MSAYHAESIVSTLAAAVAADPSVVAKVYSQQLRKGARSVDDFAMFEGGEGSGKPFIVRKDLANAHAGDEVKFTVMSQPRGPGARGEQPLRGNESSVDFKTFGCVVDFWRDAFKFTKKQLKFMAGGGGVKSAVLLALREKLGRRRMNDMKMALKLQGVGNTIFPNGRKTIASLNALDTLTPSGITNAIPQWRRLGGRSIVVTSKHGSPVYKPMVYIPDAAIASIKNSSSYEQAAMHGGARGNEENPLFSGKLLDWNGVGLFEHASVDPENDQCADPLAPRAMLSAGFGVNSAANACVLKSHATDTKTPYMAWLGGYKYEWYEGQSASSATTAPGGVAWTTFYNAITSADATYYAWIINPDGSVGFVSWAGSNGGTPNNNGNQILLTHILNPDNNADTSGLGVSTLGNFVATGDAWGLNHGGTAYTRAAGGTGGSSNCSADFVWTSEFDAGAYIIPCNANGAVDMCSLILGQDSAVRAYVGDDLLVGDKDDYSFVDGGGYETVFGQAPCIRTDGKTSGYSLLRHAGQHPGLEVPTLSA
ncbi:hypothetical protein [Prosthecobacter sp.]|uniref:hypothetical protein n=1 Tax=Prosthecobacter sp. TaxID=1965333 RepID=UPI00378337C8